MNVSVTIPTRGDVELQPIIDSFPPSWEIVIWDNGARMVTRSDGWAEVCQDLSVYGRYAAIEYCSHDLILTQDDDVIVSDPQKIVDKWVQADQACLRAARLATGDPHYEPPLWDGVVANMPQEFRHDGYTDSCLVGFGACFHRDLPTRAFDRYAKCVASGWCPPYPTMWGKTSMPNPTNDQTFLRTCDVVFTTLTPRVLVDVPRTNREFATGPDRMYRQPGHVSERTRMLDLARKVRDA